MDIKRIRNIVLKLLTVLVLVYLVLASLWYRLFPYIEGVDHFRIGESLIGTEQYAIVFREHYLFCKSDYYLMIGAGSSMRGTIQSEAFDPPNIVAKFSEFKYIESSWADHTSKDLTFKRRTIFFHARKPPYFLDSLAFKRDSITFVVKIKEK